MLRHSAESRAPVNEYLERLRREMRDSPERDRQRVVAEAEARIELEMELAPGDAASASGMEALLRRVGDPAELAARARAGSPAVEAAAAAPPALVPCGTCRHQVSPEARACPQCGASLRRDIGFEWRSKAELFGLPLVHVAVGRHRNGKLRVAKGIVAIGQFGIGAITIAQFGVGAIFGLGQFVAAPLAVGQFAFGLVAAGQFGIGLLYGAGQVAAGLLGQAGLVKIGPELLKEMPWR